MGDSEAALELAGRLDHTLLAPEAVPEEVERLCAEARTYGFAAVCVNGSHIPLCARLLQGSGVAVSSVVGFPFGACTSSVKLQEAREALGAGADELDMVANLGAIRAGDDALLSGDVEGVAAAAHAAGARLKVILEVGLWDEERVLHACRLVRAAGADFVKNATGFLARGATPEDVMLLRRGVGPDLGVKAAGGIRTAEEARALIAAGADRLGTSAALTIVAQAAAPSGDAATT